MDLQSQSQHLGFGSQTQQTTEEKNDPCYISNQPTTTTSWEAIRKEVHMHFPAAFSIDTTASPKIP